jgi:hypothetical protein
MANMCSNFITITGDDLIKIRELLSEAEQATQGWLPDEILKLEDLSRYLFDVSIHYEGDDHINVYCETKWAPPTEELDSIGKIFNVNITNLYEEMGSGEYGFSYFKIETMKTENIFLEEEDFDRVSESEDGFATLDGNPICGIFDAYERILAEKVAKHYKTMEQ